MPEIKDDFRPDKMTSAQMDTVVADVRDYIFTNWENKKNPDFSGISGTATKIALRGMIKNAMKGKAKGGLKKKLAKRGWTGLAKFEPKEFTDDEAKNIEVNLKKHLTDNWDNFTNITRGQVTKMSKKAVKIADKERAKQAGVEPEENQEP